MERNQPTKIEKNIERLTMEMECGTTIVNSWYESAQVYATRLQIPLEQQQAWIERYVEEKYEGEKNGR